MMKIFKNKKTRLIAILSTNIALLTAGLTISTIAWFSKSITIRPDDLHGAILTSYFDHIDLPEGFDETLEGHQHGSAANPYVITRPVHYYNLVRLQELGTYGFDQNTFFQFGKTNIDGTGNTEPLFYQYNDNGVIEEGEYTPYLNMEFYKDSNALAPIGSARHPFEGTIQGNNLTVKNLHINGAGLSDIGIFGYVAQSAYIQQLYFDSPSIDAARSSAVAPGSINHAAHTTHVYMGYLAGHVYNPERFYNVYLNNCVLYNTTGNEYEMINTYGYFGHTDEPLESTSDSSSYTSQLVAANAYNALEYTNSMGAANPLARRYTSEPAAGNFSGAVSSGTSSGSTYYTINQKDNSGTKPYSLSSIGYSSGDAGSFKHVRYYDPDDEALHYHEIGFVEAENVLPEKPKYIEYRQDEHGNDLEPIDHSNDPTYDFYGMNDGDYIYYDDTAGKWKYAKVTADTLRPDEGTVRLNCFTISYQQTVGNTTKTYYLKYQAGENGAYDTLVNEEWTQANPPQAEEYYFCFKTSFGSTGVSRFTECSTEHEFYIYSPVGDSYVCTYAPQNLASSEVAMNANVLHTPVFVPQEGHEVETNKVWYPTLFTIGGPHTNITYDAVDNKNTGYDRNVNADFDSNAGRTASPYKGALQGDNTPEMGLFGGHKMTADCSGGIFTIGEWIDNQTTSLTNAVNYKLTSNSSDIVENSTLVIAGFKGEQTNSVSTDYAMATQMTNNRAVKTVYEVRDTAGYVLNETTGVAKLKVNYVGTDPEDGEKIFTLYSDGYICYPSNAFVKGSNTSNWLRTYDYETVYEAGHENRIPFSQWKFKRLVQSGYYTRYRFQNVGDPDRYLCYNISSNIFSTYSLNDYVTKYGLEEGSFFDNNNVNPDPNTTYPNVRCWFYIYMQQHGQTIQNVHFTVAHSIEVEAETYPFKNVTYYDLKATDVNNSPTAYELYEDFTVNPSMNVYFDTTTSQVQYFDSLIQVWKRVNIISELQSGDTVMIGAQTNSNSTPTHYFMGSQASNYRNRSSSVAFKPPYVQDSAIPSNAAQFTIVKSDRGWRFDTGSGFLYAASSSNNYLRTEAQPDSNHNCDFSISILTNGNANIVAQGNNTRNKIQYYAQSSWWGSGSGYFSCFSGSQTAIQLYKLAQSSADRSTWVGDLINNFEPARMDAVGPNIQYFSDYMKMNSSPSVLVTPTVGQVFYPSVNFKNAITLMIDSNGSRDLGTLIFECRSSNANSIPYFYLSDGTTTNLVEAGAVDTDTVQNDTKRSYLLNINAINIENLRYCCMEGEGSITLPYKVCTPESDKLTKYMVVLAAPSDVEIVNVTFTFNAVPGNIGYAGTVDYRTATYNASGEYQGTVQNGQMVEFSGLSIYYDVGIGGLTGQKFGLMVNYTAGVYTITVDIDHTVLTQDMVVNIFKYDNNASTLVFVCNGLSTTYYTGTISITVHPNLTYEQTTSMTPENNNNNP